MTRTRTRVTFSAKLRVVCEVLARDDRDAHFTAFCEARGTLVNDPLIKDRLNAAHIRIEHFDPLSLHRITPINESTAQ